VNASAHGSIHCTAIIDVLSVGGGELGQFPHLNTFLQAGFNVLKSAGHGNLSVPFTSLIGRYAAYQRVMLDIPPESVA
jgi:hypothetical protein